MDEGTLEVGSRIRLFGGYDFEPQWLTGREDILATVTRWIPGQNSLPACVVHLDESLTASGLVRGKRQTITGSIAVLELRYTGSPWVASGTVQVELCDFEPDEAPWPKRNIGAWVESHASYEGVTVRP